jgi:hypothetical protein
MREHNLHGNRQASSRDITTNFAIIEQLLFVCKGGVDPTGKTQVYESHVTNSWAITKFSIIFTCRCGEGLKHLMSIDQVKGYILGIPTHKLRLSKAIHQAGAPRKVSKQC